MNDEQYVSLLHQKISEAQAKVNEEKAKVSSACSKYEEANKTAERTRTQQDIRCAYTLKRELNNAKESLSTAEHELEKWQEKGGS